MHHHTTIGVAARVGVAVLLAGICGCAAGSATTQVPQTEQPGTVKTPRVPSTHAATYPTDQTLLFVGEDIGTGHVGVYLAKDLKKNPEPVAEITDSVSSPYGMAVDSSGTLYVADNSDSQITEYPKGQTTVSATITDGISNPLGLAIDNNGTLYVSNYPAAVTEYAPGANAPSKTIEGGGMEYAFGLALDKQQNLYIADFLSDQVWQVAQGSTTVKALNLQDLTGPVGVAVDGAGNLWVTDSSEVVNVYPPGSTTPSKTLSSGYTRPYAITSDAAGDVVVSNVGR
jgi:hypothetical protein